MTLAHDVTDRKFIAEPKDEESNRALSFRMGMCIHNACAIQSYATVCIYMFVTLAQFSGQNMPLG